MISLANKLAPALKNVILQDLKIFVFAFNPEPVSLTPKKYYFTYVENEDFNPRDIDWEDCELFSALKTPDDPQQGLDSYMWKDIGKVSVNLGKREDPSGIFKSYFRV